MSDRLLVTTRARALGRLDRAFPDREDPPVERLVELIRLAQDPSFCAKRISPTRPGPPAWFSGGEPTLRPDLPRLIAALPELGLATDGLALADERIAAGLRDRGLHDVRIGLHSARTDAHDWLVGLPGAGRRAILALRACVTARLRVEAEIVVTRPTAPHLAETVDLLTRIGVHGIRLRRVERRGPAALDFVAISPRFGPLEPYLEAAVALAVQRGAAVAVVGFPTSVGPRWAAQHAVPADSWLLPPELADLAPLVAPPDLEDGAPLEYVELFGWDEIASERRPVVDSAEPPVSPSVVAGTGRNLRVVPPPPVRGERAPATRAAFASAQASRGALDGDPMAGVPRGAVPEEVCVTWTADEPTRPIRQRLVRAAQVGASRLRLEGPLAHPNAPELLREALRLSFSEVVVEGEGAAFDAWTDAELRRLRGISLRVDRVGPGLERLRALVSVDLRVDGD